MALGNWLTNMSDKCESMFCPNSPKFLKGLGTPALCGWCDPAYLKDKEVGPTRPMSNGQVPSGMVGVYEKLPGPKGQFAAGYGTPAPLAPFPSISIPFHNFPSYGPSWHSTGVPKGSVTSGSAFAVAPPVKGPSATAQKLKAVREEAKQEEKPCNCTSRDLLTFGHRCGRKAPIDR